jgi:hypothetical protein
VGRCASRPAKLLCQNIEESDRMVGEAAEGLIPMDNLHPARDRASGGNGRNEPGNDRLQKFFRENRSASGIWQGCQPLTQPNRGSRRRSGGVDPDPNKDVMARCCLNQDTGQLTATDFHIIGPANLRSDGRANGFDGLSHSQPTGRSPKRQGPASVLNRLPGIKHESHGGPVQHAAASP